MEIDKGLALLKKECEREMERTLTKFMKTAVNDYSLSEKERDFIEVAYKAGYRIGWNSFYFGPYWRVNIFWKVIFIFQLLINITLAIL